LSEVRGPATISEPAAEQWDWLLIRRRCAREARRILRGHDDAEEAVQEALTRAWRGRDSCRTPDAPLSWCLQITRNEALRLIGRQRAFVAEPLEGEGKLADQRALGEHDRTHDRVDVDRALRQLTVDERLLISLRYDLDWSHPEIAARLAIPETTARVHLYRARKRLKALLEDHS
jgi:RNA polymerase sigma-70 factor (ECF subfamily)